MAAAAGTRRRPWWLLLLALPLVALLGWWWLHPARLDDTQLVGARGPGCVRLVIAADVSGSMSALSGPRDAAVAQLLSWAPRNLRPDDEIAVVTFGGEAVVDLPPTRVSEPASRTGNVVSDASTVLAPLVETVGGLPASTCRTALFLVGDGLFIDLPVDEASARDQLSRHGVDTLDFLVPGRTEVPANWKALYPYAPPDFFDGADSDETALALARHLADVTDQRLQRTTERTPS